MQEELEKLSAKAIPSYDWLKTYDDNYDYGPFTNFSEEDWLEIDSMRKQLDAKLPKKRFLGFNVNSTIGIAAGPLLNHNYVNYYSRLGFDWPMQKTVRSISTPVHPFPNILFLDLHERLQESSAGGKALALKAKASNKMTITNSFGMPSKSVDEWRADFSKTKPSEGQLKVISVVGTPPAKGKCVPDKEFSVFAEDFASLAQLAFEDGAQVVEMNFSCPNVTSSEGSLYSNPESAKKICRTVREQVGEGKKILVKIGHYSNEETLAKAIEAITSYADGVSAINTIPMQVFDAEGKQALPGEGRLKSGVCGYAIKELALKTIKGVKAQREKLGRGFAIAGVGGILEPSDARDFYDAGAEAIQIATGAMWDPLLALKTKLLLSQ